MNDDVDTLRADLKRWRLLATVAVQEVEKYHDEARPYATHERAIVDAVRRESRRQDART